MERNGCDGEAGKLRATRRGNLNGHSPGRAVQAKAINPPDSGRELGRTYRGERGSAAKMRPLRGHASGGWWHFSSSEGAAGSGQAPRPPRRKHQISV